MSESVVLLQIVAEEISINIKLINITKSHVRISEKVSEKGEREREWVREGETGRRGKKIRLISTGHLR